MKKPGQNSHPLQEFEELLDIVFAQAMETESSTERSGLLRIASGLDELAAMTQEVIESERRVLH